VRPQRAAGPHIPDDVTGHELDKAIRGDLRTLSVEASEIVSRHLVMAARLLDDRPDLAWEHAKAAVGRGGRLAVVREAAGVAAYTAGEYADALAQFRAARRISGSDSYWPLMADCERGLGRPERAITMAGAPEVDRLDRAGRVEMRIVASGARRDLGQLDAAVVTLQCAELEATSHESWSARLKFAYADALLAAGREDEARDWFARAGAADVNDETEASERLADLDGIVWVDTLDGSELGDDAGDEDEDDASVHGHDEDDDDLAGSEPTDRDGLVAEESARALVVTRPSEGGQTGVELDDEDDEDFEDDDNLGEFAPPALDGDSDEELAALEQEGGDASQDESDPSSA
jgi:tetratricopeptide (TPR) repeat protein